MKKLLISFFLCFLAFTAFSQTNVLPKEFKDFNLNPNGAKIENQSLDSFPLTVQCSPKSIVSKNSGITLTCKMVLPQNWKGNAGIILYKNLMSCKVYVNDQLIDTVGRSGKDFFFQPYISRGVLVPENILKQENTVRFELWNDTGAYKMRMLRVTDDTTYGKLMRCYNFLDVQLPRFACTILLFVVVYSLFMFINYREKREFLHLALSALFFAIYLLNVTVYDSFIRYTLLKSFLYACFPASIIFIIKFFRRFFVIQVSNKIKIGLSVVGIIFIVGYFLQRTTADIDAWHSVMLIYPFTGLGFGVYGVIKSWKINGLKNVGAGVGIVAAILFSAYDMYNFMFDITPFILLQGIGFMCLIIGTFYTISQDIADTNKRCAEFAIELEDRQDRQDAILEHVKGASEKAGSAGQILDTSISSVSALVTQYLASIDQVNSNIQVQHDQVQSNKMHISKIFDAIDKMSEMVTHHEKLVTVTVNDINDLTAGINKTDTLVKGSSDTIQALTEVCTAADKDVANSSRLVDDLASYSKNIYEIVGSISDLAQQTNVLSINAAIEAARSGNAGRGFSVVAGEIRSLATQSGENAGKINTILSTMVDKISNIQNQEALVSSRLKDVIVENEKTQNSIEEIFRVLKMQLEQSGRITSIINDLVATVHSISEQTSNQKLSGQELQQSLDLLATITDSVLIASNQQKNCNEELNDNLCKIRSASEDNIDVINELTSMLE